MGRCAQIKKHSINDFNYYYEVYSPDYTEIKPFFVGIDSRDKLISFFKTDDFSRPTLIYNMSNPQEIHVEGLPNFLLYASLVKAKEALEKMEFPEYLSFQS